MFEALFGSILLAFEVLLSKKKSFALVFKQDKAIFALIFIGFLVACIFEWWLGLVFVFIFLLYICIRVYLYEKKPK